MHYEKFHIFSHIQIMVKTVENAKPVYLPIRIQTHMYTAEKSSTPVQRKAKFTLFLIELYASMHGIHKTENNDDEVEEAEEKDQLFEIQ